MSIASLLQLLREKCVLALARIKTHSDQTKQPSAEAREIQSIFGDKQRGFAARVTANSHVSVFVNPSTEVGPNPLHIPVSGHNLVLELAVAAKSVVLLDEISATVVARKPLHADGVSIQSQPGVQSIELSEDLAVARQRSLANYLPLEIPHFEVLLDYLPPIVRSALDENGAHVRGRNIFPLQLNSGSLAHLVLAPLTDDRDLIEWELCVNVLCDGEEKRNFWELKVTAETTYRTFYPGGKDAEYTPVHLLAPHWYVKHPVRNEPTLRDTTDSE